MQSRAEAERGAKNPEISAQQRVHVDTRGVVFNRASGTARTDQPVKFFFPNGGGEAIGVEYHSEEGAVRLLRDVRFSLMPTRSDSAETITAQVAREGWLTKIEGAGDVRGSRRNGKEADDFRAEHAAMELRPKVNQPRALNLRGSVQLQTQALMSGEVRTLQTTELLVEFADGKKIDCSKLKRAETLGAGSIEWNDAALPSGTSEGPVTSEAARTKLRADKLEMEFGKQGKAQQLLATGNVMIERAADVDALLTTPAESATAL